MKSGKLLTSFLILAALVLSATLLYFSQHSERELAKSVPKADLSLAEDGTTKLRAVFETTKGPFAMRFYADEAPQSVKRFVYLIETGFFNGLSFFRVEPGFMVQSGDPKNDGSGGTGVKLAAEFSKKKHVPGSVALARAPLDPHSSDSQFYITLGTFPHLDGLYTLIGKVVEGIEVVEKITKEDTIQKVRLE